MTFRQYVLEIYPLIEKAAAKGKNKEAARLFRLIGAECENQAQKLEPPSSIIFGNDIILCGECGCHLETEEHVENCPNYDPRPNDTGETR